MDFPEGQTGRNPEDYLIKRREAQSKLIQTTQDYLRQHQRKRTMDGGRWTENGGRRTVDGGPGNWLRPFKHP